MFPVLLQRASRKVCEAKFGPGGARTGHTTFVTSSKVRRRPRASVPPTPDFALTPTCTLTTQSMINFVGVIGVLMTAGLGAGLVYNIVIAPLLVMLEPPSDDGWN